MSGSGLPGPFDFIDSVSETKVDLIATADDPEATEAAYVPYMANRALSYFADSIAQANEMNLSPHLPKSMQYWFLLKSIRPRRRRSKWHKREQDDGLEAVKLFYGYGTRKALEAMSLLSQEQVRALIARTGTGGVK